LERSGRVVSIELLVVLSFSVRDLVPVSVVSSKRGCVGSVERLSIGGCWAHGRSIPRKRRLSTPGKLDSIGSKDDSVPSSYSVSVGTLRDSVGLRQVSIALLSSKSKRKFRLVSKVHVFVRFGLSSTRRRRRFRLTLEGVGVGSVRDEFDRGRLVDDFFDAFCSFRSESSSAVEG